jgi:hypothetical protein
MATIGGAKAVAQFGKLGFTRFFLLASNVTSSCTILINFRNRFRAIVE